MHSTLAMMLFYCFFATVAVYRNVGVEVEREEEAECLSAACGMLFHWTFLKKLSIMSSIRRNSHRIARYIFLAAPFRSRSHFEISGAHIGFEGLDANAPSHLLWVTFTITMDLQREDRSGGAKWQVSMLYEVDNADDMTHWNRTRVHWNGKWRQQIFQATY